MAKCVFQYGAVDCNTSAIGIHEMEGFDKLSLQIETATIIFLFLAIAGLVYNLIQSSVLFEFDDVPRKS